MIVDGENLIVSLDADRDEIISIFEFIKPRLEFIESISVEEDVPLVSSLLLQLLVSVKKSNPQITISVLDDNILEKRYGTLHWKIDE